MGREASCRVRFEGQTVRAQALLEQKAVLIRGPIRLSIPFGEVTRAEAGDGWLRLVFGGREVALELGDDAAGWAQRITNPPSRLDKLGVKPGMRILWLGPGDPGFDEELRGRGATVAKKLPSPRAPRFDIVFFGAARREDLEAVGAAAGAITQNGAVWIVRPKGQRTITEADSMSAGKRAGLVDVKVVSFSDTHTAEKFVIPVARRSGATPLAGKRSAR